MATTAKTTASTATNHTTSSAPTSTSARDLTGEVAFLTRALKAPTLRNSVSRLAQRARAES